MIKPESNMIYISNNYVVEYIYELTELTENSKKLERRISFAIYRGLSVYDCHNHVLVFIVGLG